MATLPCLNSNPNLNPATPDDLMHVMQEMMRLKSHLFTQMLQQVIQVTRALPALAPAPALQPSTYKKIRPTLPKYNGKMDADDHMDHFESIAEIEAWTDEDQRHNFYKSLVKMANMWYVQKTTIITTAAIWDDEKTVS